MRKWSYKMANLPQARTTAKKRFITECKKSCHSYDCRCKALPSAKQSFLFYINGNDESDHARACKKMSAECVL